MIFSGLLSIPLIVMQLKFATFNITSVVDRADVPIERFSFDGLLYYAQHLPSIASIIGTLFAVLFLLALIFSVRFRTYCRKYYFLLFWFCISYFALTLIFLKEVRHGMLLTSPVVVLGGIGIAVFIDFLKPRSTLLAMAILLLCFPPTLLFSSAPYVSGYQEAAKYLVENVPPNGRALFLGNRDGSLIFNVMSFSQRDDITILRADKLLLDIKIMPSLGLKPSCHKSIRN